MLLLDYKFEYVCKIVPELENGVIYKYNPKDKFNNENNIKLNKYGNKIFCKFKIPNKILGEGVYCITTNSKIVYIGECVNLSKRYNMGYGNISPRNCYVGGQSTNCKVNSMILDSIENGDEVELFYFKTNDRINIEIKLITNFNPIWNSKKYSNNGLSYRSKINSNNKKVTTITYGSGTNGKYHKLYLYLNKRQDKYVRLTYEDINLIIGDDLPESAYTYSAWWANGDNSHKHSLAWQGANYKVDEVKFGKHVIFIRS